MRISMKTFLLGIFVASIFMSVVTQGLLMWLGMDSGRELAKIAAGMLMVLFCSGVILFISAFTSVGQRTLAAIEKRVGKHDKPIDWDAPIASLEDMFRANDMLVAKALGAIFTTVRDVNSTRRVTPWFLKAFRMFLSRQKREEIDMIIDDINEDILEMKKNRWSGLAIKAVIWWHTITTVVAYTWDGVLSVMNRVVPLAALLKKLGGG